DIERVKVLIVDDHSAQLIALRAVLDLPEYQTVTASSGQEALSRVLRDRFAVILLDVAMPHLDGFATAALIRQSPRGNGTPIIFISGVMYDMEHVSQGYSAGAVDFLPKPVDPQVLRAKVAVFAELFRRQRAIERQGVALREAERRERELAETMYQVTFEEA